MTDFEDKYYRQRVPDPATHSELLVVRATLKQALRALDEAQLALDRAFPRPSA